MVRMNSRVWVPNLEGRGRGSAGVCGGDAEAGGKTSVRRIPPPHVAESLQKMVDFISNNADSYIMKRLSLEHVIRENHSPLFELSTVTTNEQTLMDGVWEFLYEKDFIFTNMNSDFQLIHQFEKF